MRTRTQTALAWFLALAGYWLPWLSHPAAALRLNGYELSEWVTFLPGVRDGSLPLSRLLFLAPLACLAGLGALAASQPAHARQPYRSLGAAGDPGANPPRRALGWRGLLPGLTPRWGWLLLGLAALCALAIFPPYPYLLSSYRDPEFGLQFWVAVLAVLAVPALLYLPADLKPAAQVGLAALGAGLAVWAAWAVRAPASSLLGRPWPLGLGVAALAAGLAWLGWLGLAQLFGARE
jgi:hypothetical protein